MLNRLQALRWPVLALILGGLLPLAFAPFKLWPLLPLVLARLFQLCRECVWKRAAVLGYGFGLGYFGVGVSWVQIVIHDFGLPSYLFSGGLTLLFVGFLALFPAGALGLGAWLCADPARRAWLAWPAAWVLAEYLRTFIFTGFPWLLLGHSQTEAPLGALAPWMGSYGLSLILLLGAGGLSRLAVKRSAALAAAGFWLAAFGVSWALSGIEWTAPAGRSLSVSLVQGNVPQSRKWAPEERLATLDRYRELTLPEFGRDLVIWPETAIPAFQVAVEDYLRELQAAADPAGTTLMVSMPYLDPDGRRYYNGIIALGPEPETYFKRHLVPMGEYLPFDAWLRPLLRFWAIPMSAFTPGPAEQVPIRAAGVSLGVSICYEDAFPGEIFSDLPEAALLVNVSNDAWFGDSLAPHQHLQIAQMRARESERWLLRATNTGISAVIDPEGRVRQSLPQFETGVLRAEAEPRLGLTPYLRWGEIPVGLAIVLLVLLARRAP